MLSGATGTPGNIPNFTTDTTSLTVSKVDKNYWNTDFSVNNVLAEQQAARPAKAPLPAGTITASATAKISFSSPAITSKLNPVVEAKLYAASSGVKAGFDTAKAVAAAQSEVGQSFPTGWNGAGECIVAAHRWILAGGGNWTGSGTPLDNYATATEMEYAQASAGDIIQYLSASDPHSWAAGVHTVLVTGNNGDGTLSIIEANNPGGSGHVSATANWKPQPPEGFVAKVFRF